MGVCTSTNQNLVSTNSTYLIKTEKQVFNDFEPPFCEEEQQEEGSLNSEICLLDTDELHQNHQKAQQEENQRNFVNRIVSIHNSPNSKRFFVVYDQLYQINRKVPKLKCINQSTLIQKRRQLRI